MHFAQYFLLFFLGNVQKLLSHLTELIQMLFFYLIYSLYDMPVGHRKYLYGEIAHPLQVNNASDIPFLVDKDITCMKVGELEYKRSVTSFLVGIMMRERPEQGFNCHLTTAVLFILYRIRLAEEAVIMESEHI
jgi:hypothetical protein